MAEPPTDLFTISVPPGMDPLRCACLIQQALTLASEALLEPEPSNAADMLLDREPSKADMLAIRDEVFRGRVTSV
jgi:hypothetical protein